MSEAPEVRILRGNPSALEEAAVAEAVLRIWREERAKAAASSGANPWTLAGRVDGVRGGLDVVRRQAAKAWRVSGRFTSAESHLQVGRGDAR